MQNCALYLNLLLVRPHCVSEFLELYKTGVLIEFIGQGLVWFRLGRESCALSFNTGSNNEAVVFIGRHGIEVDHIPPLQYVVVSPIRFRALLFDEPTPTPHGDGRDFHNSRQTDWHCWNWKLDAEKCPGSPSWKTPKVVSLFKQARKCMLCVAFVFVDNDLLKIVHYK